MDHTEAADVAVVVTEPTTPPPNDHDLPPLQQTLLSPAGAQPRVTTGEWRYRFCSCFGDVPLCCYTVCFAGCLASQLYEKFLGPRGRCLRLTVLWAALCGMTLTGAAVAAAGAVTYLAWGAVPMWFMIAYLVYHTRARARFLYRIAGGDSDDCCLAFWAPWCALSQMARHVYDYETVQHGVQCFTPTGDLPDETKHLFEVAVPFEDE